MCVCVVLFVFFQAEDGIRYLVRSRGLGDVYKRQMVSFQVQQAGRGPVTVTYKKLNDSQIYVENSGRGKEKGLYNLENVELPSDAVAEPELSLIHI